MGLKLKKDGGTVRRAWYARCKVDGAAREIKLATPMRGVPPDTLAGKGDEAFERSRAKAQAEFDAFVKEAEAKGDAGRLTAQLIEIKTGRAVEYVTVAGMEAAWRALHAKERCETQESHISAVFRAFRETVKRRYLYEVTVEDAARFYGRARAVYSPSTVGRVMGLVKRAFGELLPKGAQNPFALVEVSGTAQGVVHRKPLTEAELARLFEVAPEVSPLAYPLAVAAACTGLRIGDVCNLRWSAVDMAEGVVGLKTRKTGAEVFVPILPKFREVLESASMEADGSGYVFPAAQRLWSDNYDGLVRMGKRLLARAVFGDGAEASGGGAASPAEAVEAVRRSRWTEAKRAKVERVYFMYAVEGKSYREIERETGFSRGQVSMYLHEVEALAGASVVRVGAASTKGLVAKTRLKRGKGARSGSLYGWHSLRASFVVAALNAGVPLELARRVVGHTTTEMTLEYYNPTKRMAAEAVRRGLGGTVLGAGCASGAASGGGLCGGLEVIASALSALPPVARDRFAAAYLW